MIFLSGKASSNWPFRRISGLVSLSLLLFASQPCSPFGPSLPWLTLSAARPLTPTIFPSFTPISRAQPLEQSIQADCTHSSGSSPNFVSTLTGQLPLCGVRSPQMFVILFRDCFIATYVYILHHKQAAYFMTHFKYGRFSSGVLYMLLTSPQQGWLQHQRRT